MKIKDLCFEIIQKCPNNCKFCSSNSSIEKTHIIEYKLFEKVIDYLMSLGGIEEICISGGEPFLHPDLLKMVEHCKKHNIKTTIYTSGITNRTKLSEQELRNLNPYERKILEMYNGESFDSLNKKTLQTLKLLGLDKIVFDFQSICVDQYNYLMGTQNLITYVLKSIVLSQSVGLTSEIHFIPLKQNYNQINEILEIAELAGIERISILKFVPQGRGLENKDNLMLNDEEMKEFVNTIKNQTIYKGEIRIGIPLTENDEHLCTAGFDKMVIKYDGSVLPCPAFKEINPSTLEEYGISVPNIRSNLEDVIIFQGNRAKPLCKVIYSKNIS